MRVTKAQIINGITDYVTNEVIPNVDDRATKILIATGIKAVQSNSKLADAVFDNSTVKMFLGESEDGTYEIEDIFDSFKASVKEFDFFPVVIPSIPFISPSVKDFKFSPDDVDELKKRIERSV